jgi:hypothetical protein
MDKIDAGGVGHPIVALLSAFSWLKAVFAAFCASSRLIFPLVSSDR